MFCHWQWCFTVTVASEKMVISPPGVTEDCGSDLCDLIPLYLEETRPSTSQSSWVDEGRRKRWFNEAEVIS